MVRLNNRLFILLTLGILSSAASVQAHAHVHIPEQHVLRAHSNAKNDNDASALVYNNGVFNIDEINSRVQDCAVTQELTEIIEAGKSEEPSVIERMFTALFPFGPAVNALLATTYISGPPNLLLGLIPTNIDASSLSTLVSFAVGGLLGDVFLHLLPQTFVGEAHEHGARFVFVDEKRNTILGLGMFGGFLMFIVLDKTMRILTSTGGEGSHGHSHSHSHSSASESVESTAVIKEQTTTIRRRKAKGKKSQDSDEDEIEVEQEDSEVVIHTNAAAAPSSSAKLSAYLNMIADFTHNITDGLAISASFYVSKNVGATTCLAVFFHEIPHEVGDFALLIQGGFTKSKAMQAQFITAIGAYLGTFIGILINYLASSHSHSGAGTGAGIGASGLDKGPGVFGTNVSIGDLTLPFTAGGFLYIATVGVIPEILESHEGLRTTGAKIRQALGQLVAMFVGIGLMFVISWLE